MRLTILFLLAIWCWEVRCDESQSDLLRVPRRNHRQEGVSGYKSRVVHDDPKSNRKHSISSVTVQLHLKDKQVSGETEDNEYTSASAEEDSQSKSSYHKRPNKNNLQSLDADTGASNSQSAARYALPPDGFMKQGQTQFMQNPQNAYATTPSPLQYFNNQPPSNRVTNNQYPQQSGAHSNAQIVSTPAPQYFSTGAPRTQFISNQLNYQQPSASQIQYISAPSAINQLASNGIQDMRFNQNIQSNNQSPIRVQYASTPAPMVQIRPNDSPSQNSHPQMQYVSTPAPNIQYASTSSPRDNYVSTPVHFVSTQSPMQFGTGTPIFGTKINQIPPSGDKQMEIDLYDNAMSGVRNPKYSQSNQNAFLSTTPSPIQMSSSTISPVVKNPNNEFWRNNNQYHQEQQGSYSNKNIQTTNYQQSNQNSNNYQEQSQNLNAMESANNYVVNIVHPSPQFQNQRSQQTRNFVRDISKDTDSPQIYSNGDYGWKLTPKKQNNNSPNSIIYSAPSYNGNNVVQTVSAPQDYHPYPNNPFLSHISIPSGSGTTKTGSIQSINFPSDNSDQQNINVGYSIGFGNGLQNQEVLKNEPSIYANRYPFVNNNPQGFTTAFPNQNDVVKGVQVSQVNVPDQTFFLKNSNNPQEYVTNALKMHEKFKNVNSILYGDETGYGYNVPSAPFKISQNLKPAENIIFSDVPKQQVFQDNQQIVATYHGNGDKNHQYKWTNPGTGIEISSNTNISPIKPIIIDIPSPTPTPMVFVNNNPNNDVITNTPYFITQKNGEGKIIQTFDHANALKNIQPIDISNVVYSTPIPDTINTITLAPNFLGTPTVSSYPPPINSLPPLIQHFPSDQSNFASTNNFIDQGLSNIFNNYKPMDHSIFSNRNLMFNMQPKPQGFGDMPNPYIYGKFGEQFDSGLNRPFRSEFVSTPNYAMSAPDSIGHASNIETKHSSNMVYVPSETFRHSNQAIKDSQSSQTSAVHVSHVLPDGQSTSKYQHTINHEESNDRFPDARNKYDALFEGRINQNMAAHNLEPIPAASETNYRIINTNQRQSDGDVMYDNQNDIDPATGGKLTTIHGIKVANPYNVDLKIVSDMLKGKPAVDESRLQSLREQMSRLPPIKLDTSALQDVVSKNEHISVQIDIPDHDIPNTIKNKEFVNYDPLGLPRMPNRANERQSKNFKSDISDQLKQSHPAVPLIASEQLQNSVQSVLNSHEIGAVMDTKFQNQEDSSENYPQYDESEYPREFSREERIRSASIQHPNSLISEDKHVQTEIEVPYPLLQPPKMVSIQRTPIKTETRHYGNRFHRVLRHRRGKVAKPQNFKNESDEYDNSYGIQTELRPPPVDMKSKAG